MEWYLSPAVSVATTSRPSVSQTRAGTSPVRRPSSGRSIATRRTCRLPLLYDGILYLLKSNSGILSAFDAKSGKPHYQLQRLDGIPEVFSSPVGANGRVYLTGRDGTTMVIRHGPAFEVLSQNRLDDGFDASPALVDSEIFMRGYRYLYAIAVSTVRQAQAPASHSPRLTSLHSGEKFTSFDAEFCVISITAMLLLCKQVVDT